MNILHIIGFLGLDPEERFTPSGQKLWVLRVATRTRKSGQEETIWWRITVWGDQFDKILAYFKKGKPIYIIAEMGKLDIYTDKNGQPQVSYEATARSLHFLPLPMNNERQDQGGQQQYQQAGGFAAQQQPQAGGQQSPHGGGSPMSGQQQPRQPESFAASMDPAPGAVTAAEGQDVPEQEEDPIPF